MNFCSGTPKIDNKFVPEIQILRALAAIVVVVFHAPGAYVYAGGSTALDFFTLQVGVDLFFVISGFVMLHVEDGTGIVEAAEFMKRRIVRIAPMYWLFTTVFLFLVATNYFHVDLSTYSWKRITSSYFFWPHRNSFDKGDITPIYNVGWTLNYEAFFYFVFAVAMLFKNRYRVMLISAPIVTLITLRYWFDLRFPWYFWSESISGEFILGMLVAFAYRLKYSIDSVKLWLILIADFILFFFVNYYRSESIDLLGSFSYLWRLLLWGVPSAIFVFCLISIRPKLNPSLSQLFQFAGNASYSIYLSHALTLDLAASTVVYFWRKDLDVQQSVVAVILTVTVSVLAGMLVHVAIERPLQRSLRRLTLESTVRNLRFAPRPAKASRK